MNTGGNHPWRVLVIASALLLSALGAYWNSFNVPFLLDDALAIDGNSSIRHPGQIGDVLAPPASTTTAGRPLLNLSFALNYALGGLSVRGYHVANLLIHICAGLALLGIVRRTLLLPSLRQRYGEAALPLAACAALLWTLHPLQTASVTYISQRAESLMGLFYLLTLYGFIRSTGANLTNDNEGNKAPRQARHASLSSLPSVKIAASNGFGMGWLVLSVTACFCGMATKQVMVTAPVLVLLYDRAFVSGSFRSALAGRRWYYAGLAATWLLLGFLMHRSPLAAVSVGFQSGVSWLKYALIELQVVTGYLKLAVWPHPLVFDYGTDIFVTHPLAVAPYALFIAIVAVGVVIAWRRSPKAGFLGCCFFLILAPTSTVIPIAGQPMAESRMYLPLAAAVVSATLLVHTFARRKTFWVLAVLAVLLGTLTARRNHDYRSELSICENTAALIPRSSRAHCSLGIALAKTPGRQLEAVASLEEALRLNPANPEAHYNLASVLTNLLGKPAEAIPHCEEALRIKPDYAEAHCCLANALAQTPGRLPEAIAHAEEALRLRPDYAEAHYNLAVALAKAPGRQPEAIAHYEEALRLRPDYAEAHNNLANAFARIPGRLPDAIAHYEEALRLKPGYAKAHNNLASALATLPERRAEAIAHYEEALRLNPDYAEAHNNLANLLADIPARETEAIAHYKEALRLRPDYAEAHYNLAIELAKTPGSIPEVIAHYEEAVRSKPDYVDARNNLAAYYAETGRLDDAVEQLEIAARLDPNSAAIRRNLEELRSRWKR